MTLLVEGGLFVASAIWLLSTAKAWPPISSTLIVQGLVWCIPLLIANFALIRLAERSQGPLANQLREFKHEIVRPLAESLSFSSIVVVSLLAGIGEEFFFRGLLQHELGVLLTNVLFAVLHFGPAVKRFYLVLIIYFFFGLYFSFLTPTTDLLWLAAVTHASYDLLALLLFKHYFRG